MRRVVPSGTGFEAHDDGPEGASLIGWYPTESEAEDAIRQRYEIVDKVVKFTMSDLIETAKSLFDPADKDQVTEYGRGICDLLANIMFEHFGEGEGVEENMYVVAERLGIRSDW